MPPRKRVLPQIIKAIVVVQGGDAGLRGALVMMNAKVFSCSKRPKPSRS